MIRHEQNNPRGKMRETVEARARRVTARLVSTIIVLSGMIIVTLLYRS